MIKIAIMGYGTIGSGVYEVLEQNQDVIAADVGQEIQVKYILDLRDFPGTPAERKIIREFSAIAEDEESKSWWRPWAAWIRRTPL